MKPSWNQQFFLHLNHQLGERPMLDNIMLFFAHYLVYGLVAVWIGWGIILAAEQPNVARMFVALGAGAFFLSYVMSYGVALLWQHERPARELPAIRQLFAPFGMWKSFPSDHTIAVTILVLTVWLMGGAGWFVVLLGCAGAAVAIGRVYAGVHYPRDIIGGFLIAVFGVICSYSLFFS